MGLESGFKAHNISYMTIKSIDLDLLNKMKNQIFILF
jgi:hypothetical protein